MVRPICTLNNSDGYDKQQTKMLNQMLLAERNRWVNKSKQLTIPAKEGDALDSASEVVITPQALSYAGFVGNLFYLDSKDIPMDKDIKLMTLRKTITSLVITGNRYVQYEEEDDLSLFFQFWYKGKEIWCRKLSEVSDQFRCYMLATLER